MSNLTTLACIPAYNEESTIGGIVLRAMLHVDFVIVCDDGSSDLTGDVARGVGALVVTHEKNLGKGASIQTAFKQAHELNPDIVVMLDGDGQHGPEYIPSLTEPILEGKADVVIGSRFVDALESDVPFYRKIGLNVVNFVIGRRINNEVIDTQSGFRAFSSKAFNILRKCDINGFGVETEQLFLAKKKKLKMLEVPVKIKYSGLVKTSKKNPISHGTEIILTIIQLVIEDRPLLLLGVPGFLATSAGIIMGLYFFWYFNVTRTFSIPLALMALGGVLFGALLVFASLILFSISKLRLRS